MTLPPYLKRFCLPLLILCCGATYHNTNKLAGYDLAKPDTILVLPDILREISGLTEIDTASFACIQDENGILFIYDVQKNKIKKQYIFNMDGDYEGIARVGKTMYVLRSDGMLFELLDYDSKNFKVTSYRTGIPANNNEGLCYDPDNNRLLIASKGKTDMAPEHKDKRVIYGFNLTTKSLSKEPVFDFNLDKIREFAWNNKIEPPARTKKNGEAIRPAIKFATSAICIHPLTKKLYLLSATDHMLFVFDMNGDIQHIEPLNPGMFNKAEGITFSLNGDMLITNEGQDKKPTLLRFRYKL